MDLILSADLGWGIGRDNRLLYQSPRDLKRFRDLTMGKIVIMGRKTLESLPGGKPLPGRKNIVISRNEEFTRDGVTACHSLEALFACLKEDSDTEQMVIGGGEIYRLLMPYCARAFVTRWQARAPADSFAPDFDRAPGWELVEQSPPVQGNGTAFAFCTYRQERPLAWGS